RLILGHARLIALKQDLAVLHDQHAINIGRIQILPEAHLLTIRAGESQIGNLLLHPLGLWQYGNSLMTTRHPPRRKQLPRMMETPARIGVRPHETRLGYLLIGGWREALHQLQLISAY